jgi:ABC-type sugar transport system ATPase subunit
MENTAQPNYENPILQLKGIDKAFPGVHAVDHVDLTLYENEILGISGENGAGKSTLLKMISGVYQADEGEMIYLGKKSQFKHPKASIAAGICIIYQELSYLYNLTVAENIFLGRLPLKRKFVDWKRLNSDAQSYMQKYNLDISVTRPMNSLTMAEKQLVEIIKAISTNSKIIIMDEPTSSLGIDNVAKLMDIIRQVHSEGMSFIFISHRLEELTEICHRIVVLRDGRNVAEFKKDEFDIKAIVEKMVGRSMKEFYTKQKIDIGETILKLDNISSDRLKNVSLEVQKGSIIGLYGMAGSGQTDILRTIFGMEKEWTGSIKLFGQDYHPKNPREAIARGVCYITDERSVTGLSLVHSISDNIAMPNFGGFSSKGIVSWKRIRDAAKGWMDKLKIKAPSVDTIVGSLSGGNQQKVILAKWIENNPKLILFNEPTRGIDVATKHEIFQIVQDLCKTGVSVLMITSDMLEMLSIADRIYAVCDGTITGSFSQQEATQEKLLRAAINMMEGNKNAS